MQTLEHAYCSTVKAAKNTESAPENATTLVRRINTQKIAATTQEAYTLETGKTAAAAHYIL